MGGRGEGGGAQVRQNWGGANLFWCVTDRQGATTWGYGALRTLVGRVDAGPAH